MTRKNENRFANALAGMSGKQLARMVAIDHQTHVELRLRGEPDADAENRASAIGDAVTKLRERSPRDADWYAARVTEIYATTRAANECLPSAMLAVHGLALQTLHHACELARASCDTASLLAEYAQCSDEAGESLGAVTQAMHAAKQGAKVDVAVEYAQEWLVDASSRATAVLQRAKALASELGLETILPAQLSNILEVAAKWTTPDEELGGS